MLTVTTFIWNSEDENGYRKARKAAYNRAKRKEEPEVFRAREREYRLRNIEARKAALREYYQANRHKWVEARERMSSEEREVFRAKRRDYQRNNPAQFTEKVRRRQLRKKRAAPAWLTEKQIQDIKMFYTRAETASKLNGEKYNVDHIVPLLSPVVCGLHVPWNLQVITKIENLTKHNRMPDAGQQLWYRAKGWVERVDGNARG